MLDIQELPTTPQAEVVLDRLLTIVGAPRVLRMLLIGYPGAGALKDHPAREDTTEGRARQPRITRTPGSNRGRMAEVGSGGDETPQSPMLKLGGERPSEERRGRRVATTLAAEFKSERKPPNEEAGEYAKSSGSYGGRGR